MLKKMLYSFVVIFIFVSLSFAGRTYVIDTPNASMLNYGSYDLVFKCFSHGNITQKVDFELFKILNIGASWELDRLIGGKRMKVAIPAPDIKIRLYEGDMVLPGLAIGYDGQGCFIDRGNCVQREKGLYIVMGRELFLGGLMFNIGANMYDFTKTKQVYGCFVNAIMPVYKESIYLMAEYDNISINRLPDARLNFGFRFAATEGVDIDFIVRDCWGKSNHTSRVPNERVFKISYSGKF
ncbi:hypothetical protein AGMMS49936_00520 [Endomicrobiia bacterium]|nr:hypothetical protein AGMMS49936_00520 [Endomicrobiia bacterium]